MASGGSSFVAVPFDTDLLHRPGCVQWFHCDRCLGYKKKHWPDAEGYWCEGCKERHDEKVLGDPQREKRASSEAVTSS